MTRRTRRIFDAYLPALLLVVAGFMAAELLRWAAVAWSLQALGACASWLSLLALLVGMVSALRATWRLWRRAGVVLARDGDAV